MRTTSAADAASKRYYQMDATTFSDLARQGYNRIPVVHTSLADLDTPLIRLHEAGPRALLLPARIRPGRRKMGPLFHHRPAGANRAAGDRRYHHRGDRWRGGGIPGQRRPAHLHRGISGPLQGAAAARAAALLWRPGRLLRLRHRSLHGETPARQHAAGHAGHAGHPAHGVRGRGGLRQPERHRCS